METTSPAHLPPSLPPPPPDSRQQVIAALPTFTPSPDALVPSARAWLQAGREVIRRFHVEGASGRTVVRATSVMMDRLLAGLMDTISAATADLPPVSLAALGGYGRRELAPRSDLDLVLLYRPVRSAAPAKVKELSEKLLYALWDLKLEVGWSVRSAKECAVLAAEDHTARTALLDCRPLWGNPEVYRELEQEVLGELLTRRADQFIADKVDELRRRRLKYGDTVFLIEPNLKQGEGALRDLQGALWIARARFRAAGISDLLHRSILPPREVDDLMAARDFVWRVRNGLHYLTGRKEDRLTFELQVQIAEQLGYRPGPDVKPVELFMRHYYLAASAIKRSADALVARCEEVGPRSRPSERKLDHELKIFNGKLTLTSQDLLARDPTAIVRLFAAADREGLQLYSWARDRVGHELWRIGDRVRELPEVAACLRQMFVRPGTRGDFLTSMHELGVLGALIPEFGQTTARALHDLYHVYTVDVHCIFVVLRLYQLRNGELAEQEPSLTRLMQDLARPLPLYLAGLMHDAGKGLGHGHAERGAKMMRQVAARLHLSQQDAEDSEALVGQHLLMSHVSQRRDLSDPEMIESFARQVGSAERLKMLYLLTYADMCSVAPETWNDWKSRLLKELFEKALVALQGKEQLGEAGPAADLRTQLLERAPAAEVDAFLATVPERYLRQVRPKEALRHLRLLRRARKAPLGAALLHRSGHTELTLCAADRPGLLSIFAGALAAHRIDIMDAQIFSTGDGRALDIFAVRGPRGGPVEHDRWKAARADLVAALAGSLDVEALLARRASSGLAARFVPQVDTHVAIDNRAAADATVLDVYAQDRLGLLHTISRTLFEQGAEISLAKITTEGNRAADGFYVRKDSKKIEDPQLLEQLELALRRALGG